MYTYIRYAATRPIVAGRLSPIPSCPTMTTLSVLQRAPALDLDAPCDQGEAVEELTAFSQPVRSTSASPTIARIVLMEKVTHDQNGLMDILRARQWVANDAAQFLFKELLRKAAVLSATEGTGAAVTGAQLETALAELAEGGRLAQRLLGFRPVGEPAAAAMPRPPMPTGFPAGIAPTIRIEPGR